LDNLIVLLIFCVQLFSSWFDGKRDGLMHTLYGGELKPSLLPNGEIHGFSGWTEEQIRWHKAKWASMYSLWGLSAFILLWVCDFKLGILFFQGAWAVICWVAWRYSYEKYNGDQS
jgi:hypothetical protein